MSFVDQLLWSFRHSKRQFFESLLIVLAVGLGIGVIATVLALFLEIGQQMAGIGNEDFFRTFELIGKLEQGSMEGEPLILIGSEPEAIDWSASLSEISELHNNLPVTHHVFVENNWSVRTSLLDDHEEEETPFSWLANNEIFLNGTTPSFFDFQGFELADGNWFLEGDLADKNRVVVLTSELAHNLFGDQDPLGQSLPVDAFGDGEPLHYTVIGILTPFNSNDDYQRFREAKNAYVPVTSSPYSQWEDDGEMRFSRVSIGIEADVDLAQALEITQGEVRLIWGDQVAVRNPLDDLQRSQEQIKNYALLIGVFASVGLVIAVINILNLMLARVLKRTKGVGISMALGSTRRLVFRQFVLEAMSLGFMGSILGVFISFVLGYLLKKFLGDDLLGGMQLAQMLLSITMGIVVSLLFGAYPAYSASKINPVDALRTD